MGRLSKKDKAEIAARQTEAARNLSEAVTISAKVIIEEGLYIAIMADLWIVSGQVRMYEEGTSNKTIWAIQREIMRDTLKAVGDMAGTEIPFTGIKPMGWASNLVNSWKDMLDETVAIDGVPYYKKMEISVRMIMVLMLPGMLRMMINLTRQLIQLVK